MRAHWHFRKGNMDCDGDACRLPEPVCEGGVCSMPVEQLDRVAQATPAEHVAPQGPLPASASKADVLVRCGRSHPRRINIF